ncbi:MAG: alanine--tRNA ligase [Bacteroidetes bacterium]|nr:alanine--tRNA ligase [Bacteroidota bacterium]
MKPACVIREEFLDFFRARGHEIVPSSPVVPKDDPTLLFTNAGMNQFKDVFLGLGKRPYKRAANTQKCIRVSGKHNDLEEVGHDTYHHTFFEMLGNWSFGDYFKREAIAWAWELLTERWALPKDRLYATVFAGDPEENLEPDEEAARLWMEVTDIDPGHVLRFGKRDNFWEMGETGPCGPCSEIHIDLRSDRERRLVPGSALVNAGDPRVMEIWNLVFIQFNRRPDGRLEPLPAKHVDTGMGFERITAVLQGKSSNYDTDIFRPLLRRLAELVPRPEVEDYDRIELPEPERERVQVAMRVAVDHVRAVAFAIADGAPPSNEGRGYVVRRLLRRAVRYGYQALGFREPFLHALLPALADTMGDVFPEIRQQATYVERVMRAEEEAFLRTLGRGIELFEGRAAELQAKGERVFDGETAFLLHDTYGFPIDLTALMARERGLSVDTARFEFLMQEQRERARAAGLFRAQQSLGQEWRVVSEGPDSEFVGYDTLRTLSQVRAWRPLGDRYEVLLDVTPFYAEAGGQVADRGLLVWGEEAVRVLDVQKRDGRIAHVLERLPEKLEGPVEALVDRDWREGAKRHHTATHLVHAALRRILGEHVVQKGSLVAPDRLRFDFSHFERLSARELDAIERLVNEKIWENIPKIEERQVPLEEALARGARALFGEKYGEFVRMITFDPDFSVELCGGTHVDATGELGYFRLLHEEAVAAGVRRLEAVVGPAADAVLRQEKAELAEIQQLFRTASRSVAEAVRHLAESKRELERELARLRLQIAQTQLQHLLQSQLQAVGPVRLLVGRIEVQDVETLKQLGYYLRERLGPGAVGVLGAVTAEGKVLLLTTVSEDLVRERGLHAGQLVSELARELGGGGGGQPTLAMAGGREAGRLDAVLASVPGRIAGVLA